MWAWGGIASIGLGGLAAGALRPTNTWDYPTYLVIGAVALVFGTWASEPLGRVSTWVRFGRAPGRFCGDWLCGVCAVYAQLCHGLFEHRRLAGIADAVVGVSEHPSVVPVPDRHADHLGDQALGLALVARGVAHAC